MALWQEFISVEVTSASLTPTLKALLKSQEDLKAVYKLTGLEAQRVVDAFNQVCNCVTIQFRKADRCLWHDLTGN